MTISILEGSNLTLSHGLRAFFIETVMCQFGASVSWLIDIDVSISHRLYIKADGLSWWLAYCWNSTVIICWYSAINNIRTSRFKLSWLSKSKMTTNQTHLRLRGSNNNDSNFRWPQRLPLLDSYTNRPSCPLRGIFPPNPIFTAPWKSSKRRRRFLGAKRES